MAKLAHSSSVISVAWLEENAGMSAFLCMIQSIRILCRRGIVGIKWCRQQMDKKGARADAIISNRLGLT